MLAQQKQKQQIKLTDKVFVHELTTRSSWILWSWQPKIEFLSVLLQLKTDFPIDKHNEIINIYLIKNKNKINSKFNEFHRKY